MFSSSKISQVLALQPCQRRHWLLAASATAVLAACGGGGSSDSTTEPATPPTPVAVVVKQVAAGGWHSAAVRSDGKLYTWGLNAYVAPRANGDVSQAGRAITPNHRVKV